MREIIDAIVDCYCCFCSARDCVWDCEKEKEKKEEKDFNFKKAQSFLGLHLRRIKSPASSSWVDSEKLKKVYVNW
jgi:hypothetical protein